MTNTHVHEGELDSLIAASADALRDAYSQVM